MNDIAAPLMRPVRVVDFSRIRERFGAIQITEYREAYLEQVLHITREIHAHSIYAEFTLDEEKVVRQLSASGAIAPNRYFRLAVRLGEVLGGFYGCVERVFFCAELTARDMGWWVKGEKRGSAAAVLLLDDFEQWARARNARKCMVGQVGVENIDRTARLFQHCGYRLAGYNAVKEL